MNRFRRNLVKITNIFALLHRPHLHFTQVLNSCSCILPAAGRRPPGGSGELRSPAAVLPHRRACGRPPAPCTTRKKDTAPHRLPRTACPAAAPCAPQEPAAQPCAPPGRTPRGKAAGAGLCPAAAPPPPPITSSKNTARRRSHRSAPGVPFRAVVTAAAPPSYLPWGGP